MAWPSNHITVGGGRAGYGTVHSPATGFGRACICMACCLSQWLCSVLSLSPSKWPMYPTPLPPDMLSLAIYLKPAVKVQRSSSTTSEMWLCVTYHISTQRDTGADQSSRAKVRSQKPRPSQSNTDKPIEPTPVAPAAESSGWSSILCFALLVVMFVVFFVAYDHWTSENSLLTRATAYLNQAGILSRRQED